MDKAAELLDPKAAVWDDDVLTEDELRDVMSQVVKALSSAPIEDQEKAIRSCMYNFEGERQAAMGNMTSNPQTHSQTHSQTCSLTYRRPWAT